MRKDDSEVLEPQRCLCRPAQLQLCVPIETLSTPKRLQQWPSLLEPIPIDSMQQIIRIWGVGRTLEASRAASSKAVDRHVCDSQRWRSVLRVPWRPESMLCNVINTFKCWSRRCRRCGRLHSRWRLHSCPKFAQVGRIWPEQMSCRNGCAAPSAAAAGPPVPSMRRREARKS